ncbi:hypothetical protein HHK36_005794 [Tetracentron sinense]|uniref:pectinesterase n=1 Tax=Tetracentron sinense TaxID=13715 RepID=A0A834ZLQ5_TETSI|nr:hypothetical protein HHK36_005794 [Tetracentron sinense]
MNSSVISLSVLLLLFLLGTHLGFSASNEFLTMNFITWEDMVVDEELGRLNLNRGYNRSRVIVVAKDGSGNSVTVQGAVDLVPHHNQERVKIVILPGIYREKVLVPITKPYISFIGNQNSTTVITWNTKASDKDTNGQEIGTYNTASVAVESDYFCATGITFENTVVAVPGRIGMQAVALRISGDKAMFYRVGVIGSQDTLLDQSGTHYFFQCYIQGTVDFIFEVDILNQDCILHSTAKRSGAIAASHRESAVEDTGFSFVNCTVNGTGNIYLGRAWGRYSRAIYSYCNLDNIVTPSGWSDWGDPSRRRTVLLGEYQCKGKGANSSGRVPWSKSFSYEEARPFLDRSFIYGDQWLRL